MVALADTHAPRRWKTCPPRVAEQLRRADVILHAGDVCTAAVLDELAQYAPVLAVVGNNDGPDVAAWGATPTLQADLEGLRVAMIHDSGADSQCADTIRTALGRGSAPAQASSWTTHSGSSTSGGAPWPR